MKNYIIFFIGSLLMTYFIVSFVLMDMNPQKWTEQNRVCSLFVFFTLSCLLFLFKQMEKDE